jgi:hypothetical protein
MDEGARAEVLQTARELTAIARREGETPLGRVALSCSETLSRNLLFELAGVPESRARLQSQLSVLRSGRLVLRTQSLLARRESTPDRSL